MTEEIRRFYLKSKVDMPIALVRQLNLEMH